MRLCSGQRWAVGQALCKGLRGCLPPAKPAPHSVFPSLLFLAIPHRSTPLPGADKGGKVEIRNFLGEKIVRVVDMLPGVTCERRCGGWAGLLQGSKSTALPAS